MIEQGSLAAENNDDMQNEGSAGCLQRSKESIRSFLPLNG
jgi:hypothetical protein